MKTRAMVTSRPPQRRPSGFSVVELLVSIGVGLLALSFATRLVGQSEQHKQNTLGGSGSMQNGVLAAFSISSDAGQAGWGINDPMISGCNTKFHDTKGFALTQLPVGGAQRTPLAPVVIESNGELPDRISIYSGGAISGTGGLVLTNTVATGATRLNVSSPAYGFMTGDVVMVASDKIGTAATDTCTIGQISSDPRLPVAPGAQPFIEIAPGSNFRFNSAGVAQGYEGSKARVFNLGPASQLSFHTWSIRNGYLMLQSTSLEGAEGDAQSVVDNIVSIKAQYGMDTRPGLTFDPERGIQVTQWSSTILDADGDGTAGSPRDFQRVAALRIAVVARGSAPERPAPNETCSTTQNKPVVFANKTAEAIPAVPVTVAVGVLGDPVDWKCYRYRVLETIVPIRNNAWRPSAL